MVCQIFFCTDTEIAVYTCYFEQSKGQKLYCFARSRSWELSCYTEF